MIDARITLDAQSRRILEGMPVWPSAMATAVAAAIDFENELTIGHIQQTKLSRRGYGTLGVRTNRLRSSLRKSPARVRAGHSVTASIGTNVKYAGVHEFGFKGMVNVPFHRRRITQAFGRPIKPKSVYVSAHSRRVNFPARRMIGNGIAERGADYQRALSRAIERSAPQ